jgi:nucleoid-associated protein YgaU
MTPSLRIAFAALGLLVVAAVIGLISGSRRADPADAEPGTPLIDVGGFRSVHLLPPEQRRPWISDADFTRPPVGDPRRGEPLLPVTGVTTQAVKSSTAAPSAALPAGTRSYRIRENDNLAKIARREYGSDQYWRWLAEVNGITNPGRLAIGDVIQLPPRPGAAQGLAAAPPVAQAAAAAAAQDGGQRHVVKKGETVGEIAQKYYGSSKNWQRILEANGLKRPEDLRSGQTLVIPPPR